jgi:uncharacterized protein YecT (DUF1311 family)
MKRYFFIASTLWSACAYADELKPSNASLVGFKPRIEYSNGDPVCDVVLQHYTKIFLSDTQETRPLEASEKVIYPGFESVDAGEGFRGSIERAKINIDGIDKLLVYYSRSHSWRGDIFTGYLIDDAGLPELVAELKTKDEASVKHFYPFGSIAYGPYYTWWDNRPFKFNGKWYALADYRDFDRHDSIRPVYQVSSSSDVNKVCEIKIFENFDPDKLGKSLPFFTAYRSSLEKIMLSPAQCGTSHPEVHAQSDGRFYASMAVIRPWAAPKLWTPYASDSYMKSVWAQQEELQRKQFDDWRYEDAWSYREKDTLDNLRLDAISELQSYYVQSFKYSKEDAHKTAADIINSMPGHYYSLGQYINENKDLTPFQKIAEGTFDDWKRIPELRETQYAFITLPLSMLTLMVDRPQDLKMLPDSIRANDILTDYNKDLLMFAAHMNNYQAVKGLVDAKWPLSNKTESNQGSCGFKMERTGRTALTYATENASIHIIKYLVNAGADIDVKDSEGNDLDYYLENNPRFSEEEKNAGFKALLEKYKDYTDRSPSFSCKGKLNAIEKAICANEALSIYDRELLQAYQRALTHQDIAKALKASQIGWIKARAAACAVYEKQPQIDACIARMARARIRYLEYVDGSF